MKNFKRILALVLAVMMVATSVVAISAAEADDKVVYNAKAVTNLNKLDIMQGTDNGLEPDKNVTRAEMAQFAGRVMSGKVEIEYWNNYQNSTTFEDLDGAKWAIGAIAYAYENGVVIGKSEDTFDPNGNVTYQEALTMVVRSLGYTGLSYPNGFINKAIKLGLTDGIANVNYADAAVRGVVATILYNALYAEDSLFAENFNLKSGTYMLVATPTVKVNNCKIPGASINGYVGKELNEGYVAFAPIGADNKAVNVASKYVYAKVSQIKDDVKGNQIDSNYADKLGYAYNLTFENDVLTWGDECASKTFKNYGDNREISVTKIDFDHINLVEYANLSAEEQAAYTASKDGKYYYRVDSYLTFGNQAYNLVDGTKADYTAPTSTQDIILYADYGIEGMTVADYVQIFDGNDIVDENGDIILEWNDELKTYFKKSARTGEFDEKATAEDILAAIACFDNSLYSDYATIEGGDVIAPVYVNGALGSAAMANYALTIANNYFCEITAMDYDNDGLYDAAIYTPWYIGNVPYSVSDHDGDGVKEFVLTGITTDDGTQELLGMYKADGTTIPSSAWPHVDDYVVTGAATSVTDYAAWLYKYNRNTHEINVIEVATNVNGKVEWGVKGMPNPSSKIYEDSQVKIGRSTWQVGGWTYSNLYGLKNFHKMDEWRTIYDVADAMVAYYAAKGFNINKDDITNEYQNGWNDVLDFGMTDMCKDFKGFAIAGHLISGGPTLSDSATYDFVAFNAYQSEFAIENEQIVVDAIVDTTGKYQTIKINSVDSMEFTEIEFQIFCDYIEARYNGAADLSVMYSYFFNEARLAYHKGTALYKAIERAYIINRLTDNYVDDFENEILDHYTSDKTATLVLAVNGKNADGSYQLLSNDKKTTTKGSAPNKKLVTFNLGISDVAIESTKTPIRTNANTVFTFVAKDGIYTYVGMPADGYQIDLTSAPAKSIYAANSDSIMIVDTTRCISEIAIGTTDWSEKVQDVALEYNNHDAGCVEEILGNIDNPTRCDYIEREHLDTWAFVEYVPYVAATFHADEVYMVTAKTANSKIYFDGEAYYVYSNLYNLVDGKYEESVSFTGAEIAVFQDSLLNSTDVMYENSKGDITTNYGLVITRDDGVVACYTYADFKAVANANEVFNLADAFGNETDIKRGVYMGQVKDNTGVVSHVKIDMNNDGAIGADEIFTVNNVQFTTAYGVANNAIEIGAFDKIANNAVIFYTYDDVAGTLTGYAFN